jgi:hypothetical protein
MRLWLRSRLTFANVVSLIALFVALGGTAAAAVIVTSNSQVAQNTISGHKPPSGKHANLIAGSVNSQDIANGSVTGPDLAASALPVGRATTSSCNPNSITFVDCGTTTINLTRTSRVLIVAAASWYSTGGGSQGFCHLAVDGARLGGDVGTGEVSDNTDLFAPGSLTLTNVTGPLAPGAHTLGLACAQGANDIAFPQTSLSEVVLGPG